MFSDQFRIGAPTTPGHVIAPSPVTAAEQHALDAARIVRHRADRREHARRCGEEFTYDITDDPRD